MNFQRLLVTIFCLGNVILSSVSNAAPCQVWVKIGADVDKNMKMNLPATQTLVKPGPFPAQISLESNEQTNLGQVLPSELRSSIVQKGFRGSMAPTTYLLQLSANSNKYSDDMELRYGVIAKLSECSSSGNCNQIWSSTDSAETGDGFSPVAPSPQEPQNQSISSDEDLFAAWTKIIREQLPACDALKK